MRRSGDAAEVVGKIVRREMWRKMMEELRMEAGGEKGHMERGRSRMVKKELRWMLNVRNQQRFFGVERSEEVRR